MTTAASQQATTREITLNGARLYEFWNGRTWVCYRVAPGSPRK